MDIESRKYRVTSAPGAGYMIMNKETGDYRYVSAMPSARHLAMIKESDFDLVCENSH